MADNISEEAGIFAKYLTGVRISDVTALLYQKAIEARELKCEGRDKKLETFVLHYPFCIGFVDAALALTNKQSVLRKKIFVMLAVLETRPEYVQFFLSKKYSFLTIFRIIAVGIRSVYRFIFGFILIRVFGKA